MVLFLFIESFTFHVFLQRLHRPKELQALAASQLVVDDFVNFNLVVVAAFGGTSQVFRQAILVGKWIATMRAEQALAAARQGHRQVVAPFGGLAGGGRQSHQSGLDGRCRNWRC